MSTNKINIPESEGALERIKEEIAEEIGIDDYDSQDKGEIESKVNGKVGGQMTKRLIEYAEEEIAEKEIVSKYENNTSILKSTILKTAHHGSKTSSIEKILDVVKPQYAFIGVGENNTFGHPSNITIENLEKRKIKIYRTDKMGEICIKITKKAIIKINTKLNTS